MKIEHTGSATVTLDRGEINDAIAQYVNRHMNRPSFCHTGRIDFKYLSGHSSDVIGSVTVEVTFKD